MDKSRPGKQRALIQVKSLIFCSSLLSFSAVQDSFYEHSIDLEQIHLFHIAFSKLTDSLISIDLLGSLASLLSLDSLVSLSLRSSLISQFPLLLQVSLNVIKLNKPH